MQPLSALPAIIAKLTKSIALIHRSIIYMRLYLSKKIYIYAFMTAIKLYGQFLNHLLPMLASVSVSAEDYFSIKLNQPLSFSLLLCTGTHFQRRNF